jgi:hypothetical protein
VITEETPWHCADGRAGVKAAGFVRRVDPISEQREVDALQATNPLRVKVQHRKPRLADDQDVPIR